MAEFSITYNVTCPSCGDGQVIKKGQRNGNQRFGCKICGKWFRINKQEGRKFDAEQIGIAVRLYYSGVSYRQLAETFRDLYDIKLPSKRTFYRWVSEFTDKASYLLKDVVAKTGDKWVADEMYVKVGGRMLYHWNVMDAKTRFLLASHLDVNRNQAAAIKVFQKLWRRPTTLQHESLPTNGPLTPVRSKNSFPEPNTSSRRVRTIISTTTYLNGCKELSGVGRRPSVAWTPWKVGSGSWTVLSSPTTTLGTTLVSKQELLQRLPRSTCPTTNGLT